MSSFRSQRIVIASLFLPYTAVMGDSSPPTPTHTHPPHHQHTRSISATALNSIIDDLKSRQPQPQPQHLRPPRLARKPSSRSSSHSRRHTPTNASPPTWHVQPSSHSNGGLKNAVDSVRPRLASVLWVGTLPRPADDFAQGPLREAVERRLRDEYECCPVWIPDPEFESCYDEFCHQVLWPCLHYTVPDAPKTKLFYESSAFKQYVSVNQRFADTIVRNYREGDIIWVNDYHLMLLPLMLRSASAPPIPNPSAPTASPDSSPSSSGTPASSDATAATNNAASSDATTPTNNAARDTNNDTTASATAARDASAVRLAPIAYYHHVAFPS
ncbi:glycosyltransferase family 20-domain-containing protein, partial [Hygrophoropsis aurantiaca]